ncbi:uncharacterized protein LOC116614928 isoform X2 [Nematostella vectensis]|uniref:uncharacterized protein LOC116614928 isoform X2 n=1 Tax=Nematostella vectensis TaxID=45351 RepID=UPI00138FD27D|nr:uncharacterized protein LOC116614928 isoform X2 [Nematostella vectensis]
MTDKPAGLRIYAAKLFIQIVCAVNHTSSSVSTRGNFQRSCKDFRASHSRFCETQAHVKPAVRARVKVIQVVVRRLKISL